MVCNYFFAFSTIPIFRGGGVLHKYPEKKIEHFHELFLLLSYLET